MRKNAVFNIGSSVNTFHFTFCGLFHLCFDLLFAVEIIVYADQVGNALPLIACHVGERTHHQKTRNVADLSKSLQFNVSLLISTNSGGFTGAHLAYITAM